MCKAISDIGMAITKGKLQIFQSAEELEKAKIKKEKIAKKLKEKKEEKAAEKVKAEKVIEKIKTEKVVEKTKVEKVVEKTKEEKVEKPKTVKEKEAVIAQIKLEKDEEVEPFEEQIKTQKGITKMVESDSRCVAEINELLEVINAKEFGPGESPLRELAKIGYMLRKGVTTEQIDSLYDSQYFPALRVPQSQSALVQLVERQGYGALITEVLTEETAQGMAHRSITCYYFMIHNSIKFTLAAILLESSSIDKNDKD